MRLYVIIPTVGRADCIRQTIPWLERQTILPDGIVVVGHQAEDIEGADRCSSLPVETYLWRKGSSAQRNRGLDVIEDRADIALFLDDDYVPSPTYIENVIKIFTAEPNLVGLTGRLIADGVHGAGIAFADAVNMVESDKSSVHTGRFKRPALYGCNMAIRLSAAAGIRFDERLPLYGWQEDIDYSYQVGKHGPLALDERLCGVHMGVKRGRTSGKRFGYSQIANPLYLLGKQTMPRRLAYRLIWRNVARNMVGAMAIRSPIDRRGRLYGNLLAMRDLTTGSLCPERINDL